MGLNRQEIENKLSLLCNGPASCHLPLYVFDTVTSTNQTLWELLDQGIQPPIAALAAQQTAGRGQWGRQWQSQPGGLYLSVALSPSIPAADAPHLTLASAWGIASTLRQYQIPVWLKWPNDLVLQGRKLGGIKSETRVQGEVVTQAVVGVGINWQNAVPPMGINLASFWPDSYPPSLASLEQLAAITIWGLLAGCQRYRVEGITSLLPSYLELLQSLGQSVEVEGCPGVVVGVTPRGELRVRLQSSGAATEVSLPPGAVSLGYTSTLPYR